MTRRRTVVSTLGAVLRHSRDVVATALLLAVASPLWFCPPSAAARLGRWGGALMYVLWPQARRAGQINLRRAYGPGLSRATARRSIRLVFANLGRAIAEGVQFARRYKHGGAGWEAMYEPEEAALEARVLEDPRPKVFVMAHLGSWEVAAMIAGLRAGERGAAIVRRVDNPFLNAVVRRIRLRYASQWIEKRGATAEALRRLRGGHSIALLLDENAGPRGVFVNLFGRPASTGKTAAVLSLMTGAPIVLGAAVRRPDRLLFRLAVLEPSGSPAGETEAVRWLTAEIVRVQERWIRDDPLQWRWIHWRWRSRPDGSEERYGRRELRECFTEPRASTDVEDGRRMDLA